MTHQYEGSPLFWRRDHKIVRFVSPIKRRAAGADLAIEDQAVAAMIESCERYANSYAKLRREPIGRNIVLGAILLEVLHGTYDLTADRDLRERVVEIISGHALDLEE